MRKICHACKAFFFRCASRYAYHPQAVGVSRIGFRVMLVLSA
ncbi:MAG: hypothetical protein AB4057_02605 [Crocosphaera sp.]